MDEVFDFASMLLLDGLCTTEDVYVVCEPCLMFKGYYRKCIEDKFKLVPIEEAMDKDFDIIFIANTHSKTIEIAKQFINMPIPFSIYFASDSPDIEYEYLEMFNPIVYFLREYYFNSKYDKKCYPLPFCSPFDIIDVDANDRPIDIFFIMSDNNPARKTWHRIILDNFIHTNSLITFHHGLLQTRKAVQHPKYLELLGQSKICINIRGFGAETVRFYEGLSCGALLITDQNFLIRPNPFIHENHLFYTEESRLAHYISQVLNNYDTLKQIAINGQKHLIKHHTTEERAKYAVDIIGKHI